MHRSSHPQQPSETRSSTTVGKLAGVAAISRAFDDQVRKASEPFADLLDSCLNWVNAPEAYDWFSILRLDTARYTFATLSAGLEAKFGPVRDNKDRTFNENSYAGMLRSWQESAAEYVRAWGGSTAGWPDTTGAHHPKRWNDHNPVLDLVKDGIGVGGRSRINAYGVFFSEPDVREALLYWRITGSGLAEWKNGRIMYTKRSTTKVLDG